MNFADSHPDTAIIVTADHAQAAQILPEPSLYPATLSPLLARANGTCAYTGGRHAAN